MTPWVEDSLILVFLLTSHLPICLHLLGVVLCHRCASPIEPSEADPQDWTHSISRKQGHAYGQKSGAQGSRHALIP